MGRFQPFHLGHLHAIEYILDRAEEVVLAIGSSQHFNTWRNPLSVDERYEMIVRALRGEGIPLGRVFIVNVPDIENEEEDWGKLVLSRVPRIDVAYSNDPQTVEDLTFVGIAVRPIPFRRREAYAAHNIRKLMLEAKEDWRDLVPTSVGEFLRELRMEERMREIKEREKKQLSAQEDPERLRHKCRR